MRNLAFLLAFLSGCQSCDRREHATPPPMPTGMLVPQDATVAPAPPLVVRMRASETAQDGWLRVSSGRGVRWVSVTAFSLMENAFARAEPGFGPFGKRSVGAEHAPRLVTELRALADEWRAVPSVDAAREKSPETFRDVSPGEWGPARDAFVATVETVAAVVDGEVSVGP